MKYKGGIIRKYRSKQDFIDELHVIHPDIELIGEYINTNHKSKFRCKKDGHEWEARVADILKGHGCPRCAKCERYTTESFKAQLAKLQPNIILIGEYTNTKTHVMLKCTIDGYEWSTSPSSIIVNKNGCPRCSGNERYTPSAFREKVAKVNPNVEIISDYVNNTMKLNCVCKICGNNFWTDASRLLSGGGCTPCGYRRVSQKLHISLPELREKVAVLNPSIKLISEFYDKEWRVNCRCEKDGYEWVSSPHRLLQGYGCAKCSGVAKKTTESFIDEMHDINSSIVITGKYKGTHTKIGCKCSICGHLWSATPRNLLAGWGCPHCRQSHGENEIASYLRQRGIEYKLQYSFPDCKNEHVLLFDFYLPSFNTLIEYDGEQHFRPVKFGGKHDLKAEHRFKRVQMNDAIKNEYSRENNIKLIRIPYTEFDNIQTILDNNLL